MRSRCKEHIDDLAAFIIILIRYLENKQYGRHQHDRNDQRITERSFKLLIQLYANAESDHTEGNSK